MLKPGRSFNAGDFRFGFNGQKKIDEISGTGNHNTALFWEYDIRLGRRWNRDPISNFWESPYIVIRGNPIAHSDPFGDQILGTRQARREFKEIAKANGSLVQQYKCDR